MTKKLSFEAKRSISSLKNFSIQSAKGASIELTYLDEKFYNLKLPTSNFVSPSAIISIFCVEKLQNIEKNHHHYPWLGLIIQKEESVNNKK